MDWTIASYSAAMLVSAVVSAIIGKYALDRKNVSGAVPLAIMCLGVLIWTLSCVAYVHIPSADWKEWIVAVQFAGVAALPPAWLTFTLRFTGHHSPLIRLPARIGIVVGAVMVLLVATNHQYKLIWHDVHKGGVTQSEPTWIYWTFIGYVYFLTMTGITVIAARMFTMSALHRHQGFYILLAGLAPVGIDMLTFTGIIPKGPIDPVPIGFLGSVLLLWMAMFRYKMLDLTPVAHELLLRSISDGLIAVDNQGRIIEMNEPAQKMLPDVSRNIVGKPAGEALSFWNKVYAECGQSSSGQMELHLEVSGQKTFLEVRLMPLLGWQAIPGHLLILRDISERRRAEAEREALIAQLQDALGQVKRLSGLLPICSNCKKIRDKSGDWHRLESYLHQHSEAQLTHGLCPDCVKTLFPDYSE